MIASVPVAFAAALAAVVTTTGSAPHTGRHIPPSPSRAVTPPGQEATGSPVGDRQQDPQRPRQHKDQYGQVDPGRLQAEPGGHAGPDGPDSPSRPGGSSATEPPTAPLTSAPATPPPSATSTPSPTPSATATAPG
jgi:hypothetical protein